MTKINLTTKKPTDLPKKYCRLILTEDATNWHRLVETKDGMLEYRLGTGKTKDLTVRKYRTLVRTIIQAVKSHQIEFLALEIDVETYPHLTKMGAEWFYQTLAENLALASYEYGAYKTKAKNKKKLQEVTVNINPKFKKSFSTGIIIAEGANATRDIANTPGDDMTPKDLAAAAVRLLKGTTAKVKVLDEKEIKKQKMGLLEAVGKGADDKPRFIVIEYWGLGKPTTATKKNSSLKPIILVGKGITYDTGGLNVKPAGYMHEMHMDMSGGAAVIGSIRAIAKLGLKKNVIGLIPAAENSISAKSMRAGDIATSMSGQTVEILHTDAEGRLVLADALTYAQKYYDAKLIVDMATLTGAAAVALGEHANAVLTKDKKLQDILVELGEETGD